MRIIHVSIRIVLHSPSLRLSFFRLSFFTSPQTTSTVEAKQPPWTLSRHGVLEWVVFSVLPDAPTAILVLELSILVPEYTRQYTSTNPCLWAVSRAVSLSLTLMRYPPQRRQNALAAVQVRPNPTIIPPGKGSNGSCALPFLYFPSFIFIVFFYLFSLFVVAFFSLFSFRSFLSWLCF